MSKYIDIQIQCTKRVYLSDDANIDAIIAKIENEPLEEPDITEEEGFIECEITEQDIFIETKRNNYYRTIEIFDNGTSIWNNEHL